MAKQISYDAEAPVAVLQANQAAYGAAWPAVDLPREEYLGDGGRLEDRFPSPAIFPNYTR